MVPQARRDEIAQLLAQKAKQHPECGAPLSFPSFRRICAREHVAIAIRPHPIGAQLIPMLGAWTIVIDSRQPKGEALVCGAHELGHLWLHHDPFFSRHETMVYDVSPDWHDEVREAEADVFAELLVRGPTSCPPPDRPVARRGRATTRRADPDQLALEVNSSTGRPPVGKPHDVGNPGPKSVHPRADARAYERRLAKQGAKKMTPRVVADRRTPDDERIVWGNGTRPTRYVEPDGHRWTIYNARIAIVGGRAKLELVRDFMDRRATHRIFVDSAGQRRVYRFVPNELRAYKCKHLDRQLAAAKQWPRRRSSARIASCGEEASL
jgi:hypothetical protein